MIQEYQEIVWQRGLGIPIAYTYNVHTQFYDVRSRVLHSLVAQASTFAEARNSARVGVRIFLEHALRSDRALPEGILKKKEDE